MAEAGAIRAGKASVEMSLDDALLRTGLEKAMARFRSFLAGVRGFGARISGFGGLGGILGQLGELPHALAEFSFSPAGIVTGILAAAHAFATAGSALKEMSERTGIAIEQLGGLRLAAVQNGVAMED